MSGLFFAWRKLALKVKRLAGVVKRVFLHSNNIHLHTHMENEMGNIFEGWIPLLIIMVSGILFIAQNIMAGTAHV